ncbi:uncharacterized protein [Haliotis asinina]|uniref:uncharacterized protein n=1 Tax=Haliotis asinina TaxID=109174 RepID=UPI00353198D5
MAHAKDRDSQFEFGDFTDGTYMERDFFICHPEALRFCLYCDDFEVANPIGSHKKKHKLTIMYWSLLNIEPEFRFKLQCTQLLAVAKTSDIKKFGFEPLLKDFVSSMKKLHGGYELMIDGKSELFYGTLLCVVGDTPAAQMLGGFKEGVGFAEKPCRTCEISRDDLSRSEALTFPLRSELEHRDRCENLSSLSRASQQYWSKKYGVVSASFLLDIPDFTVTKCILHDPMHVLLEGIVKMELQLLLEHFIDKQKYFTLKDMNRVILNFDYGPDRMQDKPQPLERKSLDRKHVFPMTAVETL